MCGLSGHGLELGNYVWVPYGFCVGWVMCGLSGHIPGQLCLGPLRVMCGLSGHVAKDPIREDIYILNHFNFKDPQTPI